MRQPTDTDTNPNNTNNGHQLKSHKFKIVAINVNGLNNLSKRNETLTF